METKPNTVCMQKCKTDETTARTPQKSVFEWNILKKREKTAQLLKF